MMTEATAAAAFCAFPLVLRRRGPSCLLRVCRTDCSGIPATSPDGLEPVTAAPVDALPA
jgi:hypothetical protein